MNAPSAKVLDSYLDRLLRLPEVQFLSGLKKTSIYDRADGFPAPVKIGRATAWRESEVNAWIASRPSVGSRPASRRRSAAAQEVTARARP